MSTSIGGGSDLILPFVNFHICWTTINIWLHLFSCFNVFTICFYFQLYPFWSWTWVWEFEQWRIQRSPEGGPIQKPTIFGKLFSTLAWKQESPPAWTQEAYCLLHSKHTPCCSGGGGYLPWWGEGVPTLVGGYLPWWGGTYQGRYLPTWEGRYPPTQNVGTPHPEGRYPPIHPDLGR